MDTKQIMDNERRDYFRVDDELILRIVSSDEDAAYQGTVPEEFLHDSGFGLINDLQRIDHENQQLLNQFAHTNRELELYLRGINKKIDLIAKQLVENQQTTAEKQKVCISEGGIAFYSDQPLHPNTIVAMQMFLLPSYVSIVVHGRVINCQSEGNQHFVSTMFIALSDANRQVLAKQIMQVQLAEKRQQSEQS